MERTQIYKERMEKGKMRRSVKKAAAFLLAFALVFSMAGSGRMVVSAQQAAETAAESVEEKAQVLPSQQNVGTQDENGGTPQENVQNEEPQPGGETPSGSEGGTEDENGPSDQGQNTDENGGETPSGENPSEDNSSEKPSGDEPAPADPSEDTSDKEDGKDPSGVTDGKEEPSTDGTSGTEGGTTDGSSDDQTVSGNDVPEEETPEEDAGENASEGSVSGNSVSANRIPSGQMAANGIAAMAISGPRQVRVEETITLSGTSGGLWQEVKSHSWTWEASGGNGGEVLLLEPTDGSSVDVKGVSEGAVKVTHTFQYKGFFDRDWHWGSESYTIEVLPAESDDGEYDLYIYTLIPGKEEGSSTNPDEVWNGMGVGSISGLGSPSRYSVDLIVDDGYGDSDAVIDYATDGYPDIWVDGEKYSYARTEAQKDQQGYYTVDWLRVIVSSGANAGNNGKNPVVSSGTNTYHLDGVVTLNEKNMYTVQFRLQDAGSDSFDLVDPVNYSRRVEAGYPASKLKRPDNEVCPATKTVNGIVYTFDGWYEEEDCVNLVDWETKTITENTVFYARYIPAAQNITITKDVTGGLGDVQKSFEFTYSYQDASEQSQTGSFYLKDNESTELENIPAGTTLTLEENNASGYTIWASYNGKTIYAEDGVMEIPIVAGCTEITVTNNKEVTPDTGILLDSAPHVLGLLLVTAGAAALLTGRRKEHLS